MTKDQNEYLNFVNKIINIYKIEQIIPFRLLLAKAISKYDKENKENFLIVFNFLITQFSTLSDEELSIALKDNMSNVASIVKNN